MPNSLNLQSIIVCLSSDFTVGWKGCHCLIVRCMQLWCSDRGEESQSSFLKRSETNIHIFVDLFFLKNKHKLFKALLTEFLWDVWRWPWNAAFHCLWRSATHSRSPFCFPTSRSVHVFFQQKTSSAWRFQKWWCQELCLQNLKRHFFSGSSTVYGFPFTSASSRSQCSILSRNMNMFLCSVFIPIFNVIWMWFR